MSVGAIIVTMLLLVIIIHSLMIHRAMCSLAISMSYMSLKIFWK